MLIWDDAQKDHDKKFVLEFTFAQPVMAVRMRSDRCVTFKMNFTLVLSACSVISRVFSILCIEILDGEI